MDVVGVRLSAEDADAEPERARVVVVTDRWGSEWDERAAATRLVAGAIALRSRVAIVHLSDDATAGASLRKDYDSLFPVYSGSSTEAIGVILEEAPSAVLLAGAASLALAAEVARAPRRPRLVALPLLGGAEAVQPAAVSGSSPSLDAAGVFSDLEGARLAVAQHRLSVALPVNGSATSAGVVGVSDFGRYVLVISGFDGADGATECPPHDYLRHVFGDVAIAEVKPGRWRVTGRGRGVEMSWPATRMNLWRLMAHAAVTVDLRPPGPLGREAIESLRLGTPVVVPEPSAASELAAASNGGLWYRTLGEMADAVALLLGEPGLAERLGASGKAWADRLHGDTESFVRGVGELVFGGGEI